MQVQRIDRQDEKAGGVMNVAQTRDTVYYADIGKPMMEATMASAVRCALELGIEKVLVFTSDGEGPAIAADLRENGKPHIVAVTFPAGLIFRGSDGEIIRPLLTDPAKKKDLEELGITVVQGTLPLQQIVTPGSSDPKIDAIVRTLELVSTSLPLCVQAILMATDAGVVAPSEEIISASADTAIVASGALSHWMFHPVEGIDIREVICKPRSRLHQPDPSGN